MLQYQAYQEYVRSSARLKGAIRANPTDRESRYALVRLCISYRQFTAAKAVLDEPADRPGEKDAAWQKLNSEIEAALSKPLDSNAPGTSPLP